MKISMYKSQCMVNSKMKHSFEDNAGICQLTDVRSSRPEVFLGKGVLKMCCKFTGEHP